jgi:hypothetical protein
VLIPFGVVIVIVKSFPTLVMVQVASLIHPELGDVPQRPS